jgi:hypothetical protein
MPNYWKPVEGVESHASMRWQLSRTAPGPAECRWREQRGIDVSLRRRASRGWRLAASGGPTVMNGTLRKQQAAGRHPPGPVGRMR